MENLYSLTKVFAVGINLAFAKLLLENGCNVLIADLALRPEAQVVVDKYSTASSRPRAVFQKTDVIDWKQLEQMIEVAEREFGEIDIVCPGAGIYEPVRLNDHHAQTVHFSDLGSIGAISGAHRVLQRVEMHSMAVGMPCWTST